MTKENEELQPKDTTTPAATANTATTSSDIDTGRQELDKKITQEQQAQQVAVSAALQGEVGIEQVIEILTQEAANAKQETETAKAQVFAMIQQLANKQQTTEGLEALLASLQNDLTTAQTEARSAKAEAAELRVKDQVERVEQEKQVLRQGLACANEQLQAQPVLVPAPVRLSDTSSMEEITAAITKEVNELLKNSNTLTAFEKAKLTGFQNYLIHSAPIAQKPFKDRTKISEAHLQSEILTRAGGVALWEYYHAEANDKPQAAEKVLRTCNMMEKRDCGQKLRTVLLGALAVGIVLGSIAALVVSFGTLAPAVAGLATMGVVVSTEALGAVYGVAAVGAFLGATKLYSTYKGGLMFNTKPETAHLADVIRDDVKEAQKIAI